MGNFIKKALKDYVIRPALRSVMNSDIVREAVAETLKEEEFASATEHIKDQVVAGLADVGVSLPN